MRSASAAEHPALTNTSRTSPASGPALIVTIYGCILCPRPSFCREALPHLRAAERASHGAQTLPIRQGRSSDRVLPKSPWLGSSRSVGAASGDIETRRPNERARAKEYAPQGVLGRALCTISEP